MASPMSLYSGGSSSSRQGVVQTTSGGGAARRPAVKQLLRRLQYRLRRSAATPRRAAPVSFVYDLQSYSQNFDDGLGSSTQMRMEKLAS
jgi:hypothetical protein